LFFLLSIFSFVILFVISIVYCVEWGEELAKAEK